MKDLLPLIVKLRENLKPDPTNHNNKNVWQEWKRLKKACTLVYEKETCERRKLMAFKDALSAAGASNIQVILYARVPIVKFTIGDYDCDICIDNALALENTKLLRMYASVDIRARHLGFFVKHWAKCRGVNDASSGTLSSYSYIMLVIHFLQRTTPPILPFLQQDDMIAEHERRFVQGEDVSFCSRLECILSSSMNEKNCTPVSDLLADFFHYYAFEFDYLEYVVSIRTCEAMVKRDRWGESSLSWRFSIEDPFEKARDLGCVLSHHGQRHIIHEFQRATAILSTGGSIDILCETSKDSGQEEPNPNAGMKNQKPRAKKHPHNRKASSKRGKSKKNEVSLGLH